MVPTPISRIFDAPTAVAPVVEAPRPAATTAGVNA